MNHQGKSSNIELSVEGMHCSGCVSRIEKALHANASVFSVVVDLDAGRVSVTGQDSLQPDVLITAIEGAGFSASVAANASSPGANPARRGCCGRQ